MRCAERAIPNKATSARVGLLDSYFSLGVHNKPAIEMLTIVAVEGGIGAGKSTLLERLAALGFRTVPEPIERWTSGPDNMLALLYKDPQRWTFAFQIMALTTRAAALVKEIDNECIAHDQQGGSIIFIERSLLSDRNVFSRLGVERKHLTDAEQQIYNEAHAHIFSKKFEPSIIVHLNPSTSEVMQRLRVRNRPGEENLTISTQWEIERLHNEWFKDEAIPVIEMHNNEPTDIALMLEQVMQVRNGR